MMWQNVWTMDELLSWDGTLSILSSSDFDDEDDCGGLCDTCMNNQVEAIVDERIAQFMANVVLPMLRAQS